MGDIYGMPGGRPLVSECLGLTNGLHMHADKLRAASLSLMHTHVPGDALSSSCIVDGYEALPLLHSAGHLCWNAQAFLLDLCVEAIEVQVDDGSVVGMQALSSPTDLHLPCRQKAWPFLSCTI